MTYRTMPSFLRPPRSRRAQVAGALALSACALLACDRPEASPTMTLGPISALDPVEKIHGSFAFEPLAASAACTTGGNAAAPFVVPNGFTQANVASEPSFLDVPDMQTMNETGPQAGRFIYRTHELGSNGGISVTDLLTGDTHVLAQRSDWERLDGIAWTPWQTVLFAEEATVAARKDPAVPQALAGLVYELDPTTGVAVARPAIGSKSHEGMRFDAQGNLYSISETSPGFIFKFTPDVRDDLSSGQLYALKVTAPTGDRVGGAEWLALDRAAVQIDANAAALASGATGYNRPEDLETATSTGNNQGGANVLYAAITGEHRVIGIDLREPEGGSDHSTALVFEYVKAGVNAPADFEMPDNLALDHAGNLFITEDPATAPSTHRGDDIWVATPPSGPTGAHAAMVVRFASLTDCSAEPTGIYFDPSGSTLYVHAQHRGGDGQDKDVAITH